jgi:hypothetical protein
MRDARLTVDSISMPASIPVWLPCQEYPDTVDWVRLSFRAGELAAAVRGSLGRLSASLRTANACAEAGGCVGSELPL